MREGALLFLGVEEVLKRHLETIIGAMFFAVVCRQVRLAMKIYATPNSFPPEIVKWPRSAAKTDLRTRPFKAACMEYMYAQSGHGLGLARPRTVFWEFPRSVHSGCRSLARPRLMLPSGRARVPRGFRTHSRLFTRRVASLHRAIHAHRRVAG